MTTTAFKSSPALTSFHALAHNARSKKEYYTTSLADKSYVAEKTLS